MTDEEKNEVLLKFAGFTMATWDDGEPFAREYPDKAGFCHDGDPDLLHSLDALVKWCWPKVHASMTDVEFTVWLMKWIERVVGWDEDPAEACAEAILSLIGEQVPA